MSEMITLTENAVAHFKKILQNRESGLGVRIGIKKAGCSGFSYVVDFAKEITLEDKLFEKDGIQVVVDPISFSALKGMEIDCVQQGLNAHLKFNNPNVKGACGCGESFSVE